MPLINQIRKPRMCSGLDYKADTSHYIEENWGQAWYFFFQFLFTINIYIFALKLNTLENDSKRTLFYHIMSDDILQPPFYAWERALRELGHCRTNAPPPPPGQSFLRINTPGDITTSLIPLGRSSLRASTLGRHKNKTNSLGTKLS